MERAGWIERSHARLRVGVIGAGRVGAVLGAALDAVGHQVVAVSGLSDESRRRALDLLPGVPITPVEDTVEAADLVLLAVPSRELPGLVSGLSKRGIWRAGQIVAHTGARYGIEVFEPALASHVLPIAWHPAMRFTGTLVDLERLPESSIVVTTSDVLRPIGEALVIEMGAEPVWVHERDRATYAAAVAHAASLLPVLVEQAAEVMEAAHVPGGRRVLGPLMLTALEESLRRSGPGAHLDALDDEDGLRADLRELDDLAPESSAVHLAMTRAAASRAFSDGRIDEAQANRLLGLLGSGRPSA